MAVKKLNDDNLTDGRMVNSLTGQRNRGETTRMSIDLTREQQKEFLMEAVDHNMTLRGYFYHCWRNSQKAEGLVSTTLGGGELDADSVAGAALDSARKRLGA